MVNIKKDLPDATIPFFHGKGVGSNSGSGVPDFLKRFYRDLKNSSNAKQLTVGVISGWTAGYVAAKFGKIAATAIGGSLLLIQVAKYNGYIEIDWKKFNQDVKAAKTKMNQNKALVPQIMDNVTEFANENIVLAGGFASGFLLGFASG